MGAGIRLSLHAQEIVDSLRKTLGASVSLVDDEDHVRYFVSSGSWLCRPDDDAQAPGVHRFDARISDRWTLSVSSDRALPADTESTTLWAARKLEAHLPGRRTADPANFWISAGDLRSVEDFYRSKRQKAPEHLLVALTGTEPASGHTAMVGVRVNDPAEVGERIARPGPAGMLGILTDLGFDVRLCFASKRHLERLGPDWPFAFLKDLVDYKFGSPLRPVVVHLRAGMPFDREGLEVLDVLLRPERPRFDLRIQSDDGGEPYLQLADFVAGAFHDLAGSAVDDSSPASIQYNLIAPQIRMTADMGRDVSFGHGRANAGDLLRMCLRD